MKDYYVILGVLPDAEDIVIKAAYKALVQRYHPDRYKGNAQEAQRKTAELNEAYEVLSNPQKRADYDRTRKASQGSTSDYDDTDTNDTYGVNELDKDWSLAVQYYPDLTQLEERLRKISMPLSIGFKQAMLETKDFDKRQKIAKILEQRFLENYFGSNKKVIDFALKLILDGKKEGAKELNRTINVVGSKSDPTSMIQKLYAKHYAEEIAESRKQNQEAAARRRVWWFLIICAGIGFWGYSYIQKEERRQAELIRQAEENRLAEIRRAEERRQADLKDAQRYRDNQDGTVTDSQTGLQWKRCSEGQNWTGNTCSGKANTYQWNDASRLTSNFAGKSDWRLPNIQELNTLVYCTNGKVRKFEQNGYSTVMHEGYDDCSSNTRDEHQRPTINTQAFPATPESPFWSSSPFASDSYHVWVVSFNYGRDAYNDRNNDYYARLVRGGR